MGVDFRFVSMDGTAPGRWIVENTRKQYDARQHDDQTRDATAVDCAASSIVESFGYGHSTIHKATVGDDPVEYKRAKMRLETKYKQAKSS
jgi:hypothetical protein